MIIGTKTEFENLADFILHDYLGNKYESHFPFDIQAFAKNYLKLEIIYFKFNPKDSIAGMLTGNKIILDTRLKDNHRIGERNFTIAHECGHNLINCQEQSFVPQSITNYRIRTPRNILKTENDFKEWQANVVASCLLLRPYLVEWSLFTFAKTEYITVYGENTFSLRDRESIKMMSQYLGVSKQCLRYRLDRLGLLRHKPDLGYETELTEVI